MLRKLLLILMFSSFIIYGEEYIVKKIAFIPYGDKDNEIGFNPPAPEINEDGDTIHVEPGESVRSWDIGIDGKIYLADAVKKVIKVYNSEGDYLKTIGISHEDEDEEKKRKITSSGKEKTLNSYQPSTFYFENNEVKRYSYPFKSYFKFPADVAVDGNGNVYVIPSISANYLMKFSPNGELIEVIDKFGEYGKEEVKNVDLYSPKNPYGDIVITLSTKSKSTQCILLDKNGVIKYVGATPPRQDSKGSIYKYLQADKKWNEPKSEVLIGIMDKIGVVKDTLIIYFSPPTSSIFMGVDGEGNLYFSGGNILKYDQQSNLLARISPIGREYYEGYTFKHGLAGMAAVSKIIEDGSIYSVDLCDQGVLVFKRMIKPGTEGRILKPAITDTTKKK